MRKTKEILRLSLKEGLSQRQIAQSTGSGKSTIQDILAKAKDAGMTWDQISNMRERDILQRLMPPSREETKKIEPDWPYVHQELMKKGVTLSLLWLDFKQEYPEGYSYGRFCEHYKGWKKKSSLTKRQHHPAGKKLFVDFSGLCVPWLDCETGELRNAEIFVAVLGASSFTFAKAVQNQSSQSWLDCHIAALEFFGGAPEAIVPDNLRSGVARACRYDPDTNPAYLSFAEHYDTAIIPTRAYKPRDKAKVEVGVQVVQRWVLAILRRQTFTSVHEINLFLRPLLDQLNDRTMRHLGASRRELFESIEKAELKPLPMERFSVPEWKIARVNIDYHVEFERHYYSVPHKFVGETADIKATMLAVEIFSGGKRIAIHPRVRGSIGRHTTQPEHMPPAHLAHAEWTPERVLDWAEQTGPKAAELCKRILESRSHPEQGFRACLGIMRLGKQHSYERLEKACAMAIDMRSLRYKTVQDILNSGADSKVRPIRIVKPTPIDHHENIRGADYYS
jgi:transposase